MKADPTMGVRNPPRPKGDGFIPWTEEHVAAYENRWPVGTRQRVWLDVLLYTGLRRGDAVRLGRQHIRNGIATLKTEKTDTVVTLPILPVLAETLAAGPCGDLTFIAGENGNPLTKESFGNLFRDACRTAGIPGSAHGVRKIAATRAAMLELRWHNLRRSLVGKGVPWRRFTPEPQTGAGCRLKQCRSLRTTSELLLSHLCMRCDIGEKDK